MNMAESAREPAATLDRAAGVVLQVLIFDKFATLFQLLFGIGFAIQMARMQATSAHPVWTYIRRVIALWLIGWAAILVAGGGSILQAYACWALVLLVFRKATRRILLISLGVLVPLYIFQVPVLPAVQYAAERIAVAIGIEQTPPEREREQRRELGRNLQEAKNHGSYGQQVTAWWAITKTKFPAPVLVYETLSLTPLILFLFGILIWRSGVLSKLDDHTPALTRTLACALPLGLLGNLAVPVLGIDLWEPGVYNWSWPFTVALAVGYASGLLLLLRSPAWRHRLSGLTWLGRMPLTIFVLQWFCIRATFSAFGLGLSGVVGIAASIPLTLALFAIHILLARWWLRRFRFGPVEWFWRVLTYGRIAPATPLREQHSLPIP